MVRLSKYLRWSTIVAYIPLPTKHPKLSRGVLNWSYGPRKPITPENYPRINWVERGAITSAKHQHGYPVCYAMAALIPLQALHFSHTKKLLDLSPQYVIDRTKGKGQKGTGGRLEWVYDLVLRKGGLPLSKHCPFILPFNNSIYDEVPIQPLCITGYRMLDPNNVEEMLEAIQQLSIAVAFREPIELHKYNGGILRTFTLPRDSDQEVQHAGAIVALEWTEAGEPYFVVQNSWGKDWGDEGRFKVLCSLKIFTKAMQPCYDPQKGVFRPKGTDFHTTASSGRNLPPYVYGTKMLKSCDCLKVVGISNFNLASLMDISLIGDLTLTDLLVAASLGLSCLG